MNKHTVTASIVDFATGGKIGEIEIGIIHAQQYADCTSERYQWPEGIAKLSAVVDHECEIESLGGNPDRVVRLEI
jgi:hypothetical protein